METTRSRQGLQHRIRRDRTSNSAFLRVGPQGRGEEREWEATRPGHALRAPERRHPPQPRRREGCRTGTGYEAREEPPKAQHRRQAGIVSICIRSVSLRVGSAELRFEASKIPREHPRPSGEGYPRLAMRARAADCPAWCSPGNELRETALDPAPLPRRPSSRPGARGGFPQLFPFENPAFNPGRPRTRRRPPGRCLDAGRRRGKDRGVRAGCARWRLEAGPRPNPAGLRRL